MLKLCMRSGKGNKSELASIVKTKKDAQLFRKRMDDFASSRSPITNSTSLNVIKQAYNQHVDRMQPKRYSCSSDATDFSQTPTLINHEDEDINAPHFFDEERETPEPESHGEIRSLFRTPSLPLLHRPIALRGKPVVTLSSGVVAQPQRAEIISPQEESSNNTNNTSSDSGSTINHARVLTPRPKSEQYTKADWYPASSLGTFRGSFDENMPVVASPPSSETSHLHRSDARRVPNGPSKRIPYDDTTFTKVARKKRKNRSGTKPAPSPAESVQRTLTELRSHPEWFDKCIDSIQTGFRTLNTQPEHILCLGLGSPSESQQARFQLAFLLELRDKITSTPVHTSAYDPVFSLVDSSLLLSLGVKTLAENQHGKCSLEKPTLVFMPHCDLELYENFLRANWTEECLSHMLLIGNDLRRYTESTPSRILDMKSPCVYRLAPIGVCEMLPEHKVYPNALSSTAVQYVPPDALVSQDDIFWDIPAERAREETEGG